MNFRRFSVLVLCYALAILAGYVAQTLNLPLPWMIGPLVITACFSMFIYPIVIPVKTRPIGQLIIAAQVGLYFTADAVLAISSHGFAIVGVAFLTLLFGVILSQMLCKMTGTDPVTGFLASIPGGPVEMGNLAKRYGGDPGPVIFAQTLRISAIVLVIPTLLYYLMDAPKTNIGLNTEALDPLGIVLISLGAGATSLLFRMLRINSPFFLGALAFSCTATATELIPISPYPDEVVAFAQILLGTWLGSTFKRSLFTKAGRLVIAISITSLLLILLSSMLALVLAMVTEISWRSLILGAAPGSITEMALTAKFLQEDVALITAFHLVRIFMIMPNVPWMVALIHRFSDKEGEQ